MSDIFISYAKEDRERVTPLVRALEDAGWSVWWDRSIRAGKTWDSAIEQAIDDARCIIVLWSNSSVHSDWVRVEAEEGRERNILVPALLDDVKIPLAFRRTQAASLIGWSGTAADPLFQPLREAVADVIAETAAPAKREPPVSQAPTQVVETDTPKDRAEAAVALGTGTSELQHAAAKVEEQRRQRELAEIAAKVEEERRQRELAEVAAKVEEERRQRERAEATAKVEEERRQRERAEAAAKVEEERRQRELAKVAGKVEEERRQRERAEATAKAEEERRQREGAEAAAKAEEEQRQRERAEATAKAEEEQRQRELAEVAAKVEEERRQRERAEAAAKVEEERRQRERAEAAAKVEEELGLPKKTGGIRSVLKSRERLFALAAVLALVLVFYLIWSVQQASNPLDEVEVLGLVLAGVNNEQIATLVNERKTTFDDTETLRKAGADQRLLQTVAESRRSYTKNPLLARDSGAPREEVLNHLEKIAALVSDRSHPVLALDSPVWAELTAAENLEPQETVLQLVEARMLALSRKCGSTDSRTVVVRADTNTIKMNNEDIQPAALGPRLQDIFKTRAERVVFLEFDSYVPVPQLLQIFETVRGAGIDKIPLVYPGEIDQPCK